jgi:hypothetical protein
MNDLVALLCEAPLNWHVFSHNTVLACYQYNQQNDDFDSLIKVYYDTDTDYVRYADHKEVTNRLNNEFNETGTKEYSKEDGHYYIVKKKLGPQELNDFINKFKNIHEIVKLLNNNRYEYHFKENIVANRKSFYETIA